MQEHPRYHFQLEEMVEIHWEVANWLFPETVRDKPNINLGAILWKI